MTKAEEVHTKAESLIASGMTKPEAFKRLAEEYHQPLDSIRGAYYTHRRANSPSSARSRRRETTPEDALADARAALERAIQSIDQEVDAAKLRVEESKAEYEAMRGSAKESKDAIAAKLEALS